MGDESKDDIRIRRHAGRSQEPMITIPPSPPLPPERTMLREAANLKVNHWLLFLHEIRTGLMAGIPLLKVLDLTSKTTHKKAIRDIAEKLRKTLSSGVGMETGLNSSPWIPELIRFHLIAGMRTGNLTESIDSLIGHYEWMTHVRRKILSVCIYPAALVILGMGVMIFRDILVRNLGARQEAVGDIWLPITLTYAMPVILGAGAAWISGTWYQRNRYNAAIHRMFLAVPYFGEQMKAYSIALTFQVFSLGLRTGMPVATAFSGAVKSCPNAWLAERFRLALPHLREGETIVNALRATGIPDKESLGIISTGEYSGNLPELLEKTANRYKQFVKIRLNGLIPVLAPIFVLLMAFAYFGNPVMLGGIIFILVLLRKLV